MNIIKLTSIFSLSVVGNKFVIPMSLKSQKSSEVRLSVRKKKKHNHIILN